MEGGLRAGQGTAWKREGQVRQGLMHVGMNSALRFQALRTMGGFKQEMTSSGFLGGRLDVEEGVAPNQGHGCNSSILPRKCGAPGCLEDSGPIKCHSVP